MKRLAGIAYFVLVYLFLYLPMIVLVAHSFNQATYSLEWKGFTLKWYASLLEHDGLWEVAVNSLTVASLSASLATLLGTIGTVALHQYRFFGKRLLLGLTYALIMAPEIVMGISLLILFVSLNIPLGFGSLLMAHITLGLPFVIVTVLSRMSGLDRNLVEAAKDLGASELQTLRFVILPLLMPSVMAAWLLSFTLSMDDVIISFFVTGPGFEILPIKIYSMVRMGVKPEINALCTLMFAITLLAVVVAQMLQKESR